MKRKHKKGRKLGKWDVAERLLPVGMLLAVGCVFIPTLRAALRQVLLWSLVAFGITFGIVVIAKLVGILRCRKSPPRERGCSAQRQGLKWCGCPSDDLAEAIRQQSARHWPRHGALDEAHVKGQIGEDLVDRCLSQGLPSDIYRAIRDVYLPDEDVTSQIDEILVSTFGVFVVEVKNYSGWILANSGRKWVQSLSGGKRYPFDNPIRQNYKHRCVLSECTGIPLEYLESVVVFSGNAEFKGELEECPEEYRGVVHLEQLADYIRSFSTPRIKPSQVPEIVEAIEAWQATISPEVRAAHVENLKRRHAKPNNKPY